jgi:hypothetical protein
MRPRNRAVSGTCRDSSGGREPMGIFSRTEYAAAQSQSPHCAELRVPLDSRCAALRFGRASGRRCSHSKWHLHRLLHSTCQLPRSTHLGTKAPAYGIAWHRLGHSHSPPPQRHCAQSPLCSWIRAASAHAASHERAHVARLLSVGMWGFQGFSYGPNVHNDNRLRNHSSRRHRNLSLG